MHDESGATKWFSVMIWGGMIGNELIGSFRVPKELKLSVGNMLLAQLKKIIFLRDHLHT